MRKNLLLLLLALYTLNADAADYYWVGGGGSWSDLSHWRLGSTGGSIPSIVPSSADNVYFTSGSGFGTTVATRTVALDANGFCNNMTWDAAVPNNPLFNSASGSFAVQVSGNTSLAPTTTYNVVFAFKGTTAANFTSNGTILGEFGIEVDKPGSSLTVTDSLLVPAITNSFGTNGATFTSGTFDISGKKVTVFQFASNNTNTRTLEMTNATLVSNGGYRYTGTGKTLNATGSSLTGGGIVTDGGTYNRATSTLSGGPNTNVINGTTFKILVFTAAAIYSDIESNNTVDSLLFNGQGSVLNNNIIGSVRLLGIAFVSGGNTIRKLTTLNRITITGVNTIDSLLLGANQTSTLAGTININKYMKAQGNVCEAFTEVTAADSVRLIFAAGATALIDNVYLTNIKAYGPITPISVSGVDGDNNTGFTITAPTSLSGANLYWVGGAGDWNDNTHWSTTSGGAGGACIPFIADTVIFDSGSGLGSGRIVTTSGNSYCYNMNWVSGVGTTTFNESATYALSVYGSLSLNSAVTMNAAAEFAGTAATSTITTNGSSLGTMRFNIRKTGTGAVTLLDNWSNANGIIQLLSGNLIMSGRTVAISLFSGVSTITRSLDISNADITTTSSWDFTGTNKSMTATGSYIKTMRTRMEGLSYPKMDVIYTGVADGQYYIMDNVTLGALTFTGTNALSGVNIDANNTIRRLEFKGAGAINGANVIDTLILAGSRNYLISGTQNISKYIQAVSTTCTGLLEIKGNTTGTFQFGSSTVINMDNVYLQNMTATGVPSVAVNGADAGGNSGWTISSTAGSPRYWIGGSGDWNDASHWSTSSGGTGGACIPTFNDDVYFDANSGFTAVSKTVTVNNGNAYARNLDWSKATNSPIWSKLTGLNIEVWGDSLILNATATFNVLLTAKGGARATFLKGTVLGDFDINVDKPGSSLTMLNDFSNSQTNIYLLNGTWNASGIKLNIWQVDNSAATANTFAVNISNSAIVAPFGWRFQGTIAVHSMNAVNSSITTGDFKAAGMTYDTVNMTNTLSTSVNIASTTINTLTFTDPSSASAVGIVGNSNTLGRVEYKGSGIINGTSNTIDTLIFFPGGIYTLTNGTNTTINRAWYGSGTPCRLTEIVSSSASANATITMNGAAGVNLDYIRLRRITAAGTAAPFAARQHSIDLGSNVNWTIAPYDGASPIYGLGPDTALFATEFPYTLGTTGFFGSPSSLYTWNDASTADSLRITDTGTYSVRVNFVDGCTINDTIRVSLRAALPISLISFNGYLQGCQARLDWETANAKNFSHFVVERSIGNQGFADLVKVNWAADKRSYTYTDQGTKNGLSLYRLKLVNADGTYQYSPVVSVRSDCKDQAVTVYPTMTQGMVYVQLPAGYDGANISVFSSLGQWVNVPGSGKVDNSGIHPVNMGSLAPGVYLLKLSHREEVETFRIFLERN